MIRMNDLVSVKNELDIISTLFVEFINDLLEEAKLEKINIVGIGNSISGGWTAVDNDVCPLILKLEPLLRDKSNDINLSSFALIGNNSNKRIYESLKKIHHKKI